MLTAVAVAAVGLTSCTSAVGDPAGRGVVRVVAAENTWGDIVRQVGGAHVQVTSLIGPGADPHEWEGTAKDAAAVFRADLVVENGLDYDRGVADLVESSPRSGRRTVVVSDVLGVHDSDANPHLWYDVGRVPQVARAFAAALGQADPAHRADYAAGAEAFVASLRPLDDVVASIRQRFAGAPVGWTERVAGYLVSEAGLRLGTPPDYAQALEDGTDPSPADVRDFDAAITDRRIRALLLNRQVTDRQTDAAADLARRSGVPVVDVTETIPAGGASFQDWQLGQARRLLAALAA